MQQSFEQHRAVKRGRRGPKGAQPDASTSDVFEARLARVRWLLAWLKYQPEDVARIVDYGRTHKTFMDAPAIAHRDRTHLEALLSPGMSQACETGAGSSRPPGD
jgi:hypothetical protein